MDRRAFFAASLTAAASFYAGQNIQKASGLLHSGWLPSEVKQSRARFLNSFARPFASQHTQSIKGSSDGKVIRLWKAWEKVADREFHSNEQKTTDCVGQATAVGVEMLDASEIIRGEDQKWSGKQSTEVIYIGARVEIGKNRFISGGTTVGCAASFLQKYGSLPRGKYPGFDVSKYNPKLARANSTGWFPKGVPTHIEQLCTKHRLKALFVDGGFRQAADLIAAGFPIVVGANRDFDDRRDRDGFLSPIDSDDLVGHAILLCGIDTRSSRPGGCFANSWGDGWSFGPKHRYGCINGGFWVDAHIINEMLMQGDSYALVSYDGIPISTLDRITKDI